MGEILDFESSVNNNNKRAEKVGSVAELTIEQFETAYLYFDKKCAYSGRDLDTKISIEHIIPLVSGGHSLAFNCVPVINKYNESKSGYHLLDWWKIQRNVDGKSLYNPHRLLKLINYMIKCLECIDKGDNEQASHILEDNDIDTFLKQNTNLLEIDFEPTNKKGSHKNISKIESYKRMEMTKEEYIAATYDELDKFKLNVAIFFEEALHELSNDLPMEILEAVNSRINAIPNVYKDDKRVFRREMNDKDVFTRSEVLKWAESQNIENKYGIVGYMDFEVLKAQENICDFLDKRKEEVLKLLNANETDFNNIINKVPNILTYMDLDSRVISLVEGLKINTTKVDGKSSELYRYVTNKPDLLLSGENMDILLQYAKKYDIDKRIFKKGIPVTTILDNLELAIETVSKADLGLSEDANNRIIEKIINNSNGSLLRDGVKNLRKIIKNQNPKAGAKTIQREASRWFICISEKYTALELFKGKRINQTRKVYKNMQFDQEGFLVGVNPNAYIVPKIIRLANLDMEKEAEARLIDNVFIAGSIRQGNRADKILKQLAERVLVKNPDYSAEDIVQEASRWFVFLSEMPQINLSNMFNDKMIGKYMDITEEHYKNMEFDSKGRFVDYQIEELKGYAVGVDYMSIADAYLISDGDSYIINDKRVPKAEVQAILEAELATCRGKDGVKNKCKKILGDMTSLDR